MSKLLDLRISASNPGERFEWLDPDGWVGRVEPLAPAGGHRQFVWNALGASSTQTAFEDPVATSHCEIGRAVRTLNRDALTSAGAPTGSGGRSASNLADARRSGDPLVVTPARSGNLNHQGCLVESFSMIVYQQTSEFRSCYE